MTCQLTLEHQDKINEWIKLTCDTNDVSELYPEIYWNFNGRFTRRMGDANCITNELRFSAPLWSRASHIEQKTIVIHEAAHLVARRIHGLRIQSHGQEWKLCMRAAGEAGLRTHGVNRDGLRRKHKRYTVKCGCREWQFTNIRRRRMLHGAQYRCPHCKGIVNFI